MIELEKAARQALETLENVRKYDGENLYGLDDEIIALRQALEQPAQQQEPMAWRYNGKLHEFDPSDWATGPVTPLYTSPPAKPWVGLTDEEIAAGQKESWIDKPAFESVASWADAKLKEKNT